MELEDEIKSLREKLFENINTSDIIDLDNDEDEGDDADVSSEYDIPSNSERNSEGEPHSKKRSLNSAIEHKII